MCLIPTHVFQPVLSAVASLARPRLSDIRARFERLSRPMGPRLGSARATGPTASPASTTVNNEEPTLPLDDAVMSFEDMSQGPELNPSVQRTLLAQCLVLI